MGRCVCIKDHTTCVGEDHLDTYHHPTVILYNAKLIPFGKTEYLLFKQVLVNLN